MFFFFVCIPISQKLQLFLSTGVVSIYLQRSASIQPRNEPRRMKYKSYVYFLCWDQYIVWQSLPNVLTTYGLFNNRDQLEPGIDLLQLPNPSISTTICFSLNSRHFVFNILLGLDFFHPVLRGKRSHAKGKQTIPLLERDLAPGAQRQQRGRRPKMRDTYDGTNLVHHQFINLSKNIKVSTPYKSFSTASERTCVR